MKFHPGRFFFRVLLLTGMAAGWVMSIRAGTLTGTFSSIAAGSNVDLTATGKLDWVHWGLYTAGSINRKASVTPQISNFTLVGNTNDFLTAYQYTDNASGYTWYDGMPTTGITYTTTGVWAYQSDVGGSAPLGSGFQLVVPADTTQKTLQVYVGAYAAKGKFTASLSDGSAPSFTNGNLPGSTVDNFGNGPGGVFAITFAANSTNQTLTIQWTVTTVYNPGANVTLQATALTAPGADNPPYITLTSPVADAAFPEPATITIRANAQDFDGSVTNVAFYAGTNKLGQITTNNPANSYSFTWTNAARGQYNLTAIATDNAGINGFSPPVEIFVYGSGGGQTNSVASPPPSTVDLTAEGTADWTHWGLSTGASFDCKNLVPRQISNFTALGAAPVQQYSDNYTAFSWSDGTPDSSVSGSTTGVFITGATNGFRLTVPADTYPRQLRVYVGGYGVQGEFQAYLSDLSAIPYTDISVSNVFNNSYVVYTINYTAASANQQLMVVYRTLNLFDFTYGNVTLQAATLQSTAPPPVEILNPQWLGNGYTFSFQTQTNRTYTVQYTYLLNPASWQTLTSFSGNGTMMNVTNQNVSSAACFYRVLTQ